MPRRLALPKPLQSGEIQISETFDGKIKDKIERILRLTELPETREELLREVAALVLTKSL